MAKFRVCHTTDFFGILEYDVNEEKFVGAVSEFINDVLEIFETLASWKNQTVEIHPRMGFGDPVEGTDEYTGCLGRLQKNQSEVMLMPMDYPSNIVNTNSLYYPMHL